MSVSVPKVLILGHSFVRRLRDDLDAQFDDRASKNFHLPGNQSSKTLTTNLLFPINQK